MKGEHIQNLQILGTTNDNLNSFNNICELLEDLTIYINSKYKDAYEMFILSKLKENIYFVIAKTKIGNNNPYYAIFDRNTNSIKFYTDIDTISCLLRKYDILKETIENYYNFNVGYNIANKKIIEHIKLYDSIKEKYPNINSVEFENNYEELFDISEKEDDDYGLE